MRRARQRVATTPRRPVAGMQALAEAVAAALTELLNEARAGSVALLGAPAFAVAGGPGFNEPPGTWTQHTGPQGAVRHNVDVTTGAPLTTPAPAGRRPRPTPQHPAPQHPGSPHPGAQHAGSPRPGSQRLVPPDTSSVLPPAPPGLGVSVTAGAVVDPLVEPIVPAPVGAPDISDDHSEVWQLVLLAQQGNGEAFGQLYDRYVDTVFKFIYFRVNDRALAEDFTSETFLRALRRISSISYQGRDIGAWFVTIARNIILDHMKSARHRLEVTTADTVESDDRAPSTEAAVIDLLTSERLMAAVRQLGDEQRECVMLRFIQGFSVSETAAVMGKNEGAIKALQHRAVRKLAELVGGELR